MNRRDQMLDALAIGPQWLHRQAGAVPVPVPDAVPDAVLPEVTASTVSPATPVSIAPASAEAAVDDPIGQYTDADIATMDWPALQAAVGNCRRCGLCTSRTRTVFGIGSPGTQWLFVGEGPGQAEDEQGEPFVGPAGKLFDNMLVAMTLQRSGDVFITNAVKCRPLDATGKDRAPTVAEVAACRPFLARQVALVAPAIVVALGKSAAISLLECEPATAVASLRGIVHRYGAVPLVVTYHPAYLLRMPVDKRKSWQDLCLAMAARTNSA